MSRDLGAPIAAPVWPDGFALRTFTPADAPAAHALLQLAYAGGGGRVGPFADWWRMLAADSEYDPALCFIVWSGDSLVGVAQCWTSAFVKDLAVHPDCRRRGIATGLLLTVLWTFRDRGAASVSLKVEADNASAICFYESLGMARA